MQNTLLNMLASRADYALTEIVGTQRVQREDIPGRHGVLEAEAL